MDPFGPPRKKSRPDIFPNGNGAYRGFGAASELDVLRYTSPNARYRPLDAFATERESLSTGLGSKSKACLKFFSTSGCPYGEGCHFTHYVPGGVSTLGLTQSSSAVNVKNRSSGPPGSGSLAGEQGALPGGFKTRPCKLFNTPEGCRFGDRCHFAHGDKDVRKLNGPHERDLDRFAPPLDRLGPFDGRLGGLRGQREPTPPGMAAAASFGASSTAKISIDASLAGAIIGKGGVHQKQIRRVTGAKLAIRDHESDPNLKNIEMEGSFDQIKQASAMVRELLMHTDIQPASKPAGLGPHNFKTKVCENYAKGTTCTFGDRCHFAHGASELRQPPAST
eukprot:c26970_g2_i5 orf=297-1301(+)